MLCSVQDLYAAGWVIVIISNSKVVLGDTDDTSDRPLYRDIKSHDTSIADVTIPSRY